MYTSLVNKVVRWPRSVTTHLKSQNTLQTPQSNSKVETQFNNCLKQISIFTTTFQT